MPEVDHPARLVSVRSALMLRFAVLGVGLVVGLSAPVFEGPLFGAGLLVGPAVALLVSNAIALQSFRVSGTLSTGVLSMLLVLDSASLIGVLSMSGGVTNPFTGLLLLPVLLGAWLLPRPGAYSVTTVTIAGYLSMFWLAPIAKQPHTMAMMETHLQGMFVSFSVTGWMVCGAMVWAREARQRLDHEVEMRRQHDAQNLRLASLATLTAGAAHELGNPMSTMLVVAGELQRHVDPTVRSDAELLRIELERCREISTLMSADAGVGLGEAEGWTPLPDLLASVAEGYGEVRVDAPSGEVLFRKLVTLALRRLMDNARDAGGPGIVLTATTTGDGQGLLISVTDHGSGMPAEVLERATEPFFSTKGDGGMGMGLFFARAVAEQLGGLLELQSDNGQTEASLRLPVPVRNRQGVA